MVSIIISLAYQQQIHYSASLQEFTARKDSDSWPTMQQNHFAIIACPKDRQGIPAPLLVIVKVRQFDWSSILFLEPRTPISRDLAEDRHLLSHNERPPLTLIIYRYS